MDKFCKMEPLEIGVDLFFKKVARFWECSNCGKQIKDRVNIERIKCCPDCHAVITEFVPME